MRGNVAFSPLFLRSAELGTRLGCGLGCGLGGAAGVSAALRGKRASPALSAMINIFRARSAAATPCVQIGGPSAGSSTMTVFSGRVPARLALAACLALSAITLGGCSPWWRAYRIDVQQGNNLDSTALSRLKLGMTRDQVRFVLGTPLVTDVFHVDRWDYVYRRERVAGATAETRRIAVFFKADRLDLVEGEGFPEDLITRINASPEGSSPAPAAAAGVGR